MIEHAPGHRVMVACATSPDERSCYAEYWCEDPTCDWHRSEFSGTGTCKDFENLSEELLTCEICNDRNDHRHRDDPAAGTSSPDAAQLTMLWESAP